MWLSFSMAGTLIRAATARFTCSSDPPRELASTWREPGQLQKTANGKPNVNNYHVGMVGKWIFMIIPDTYMG